MSLTRKIKRLLKRHEEVATKKHRRKALFESLEPRLLLSADLTVQMGARANDLTLRMQNLQGVDTIQVVNNADQSVVQSQGLAQTSGVVITGSSQTDSLKIDLSGGDLGQLPITYADNGGEDSISAVGKGSLLWNDIGQEKNPFS